MTKVVHVAAGVIRNSRGQILIAKRPDDTHQGGLWEFPGGKLEPGESVQSALIRELQEELGINSTELSPLIQIRHDYPDKSVLLDVWNVTAFDGDAHGREGQPVKWVEATALSKYQFPAANVPIVTAAQLPPRLLITRDTQDLEECLKGVTAAIEQGIALIQLRQKQWTPDQWQEYLPAIKALCQQAGAQLVLNTPPASLASAADGLHLTSDDLHRSDSFTRSQDQWLSAACHSPADIRQAEALGVDFVTLSPVKLTQTHPETPVLGWDTFEAWVKDAKLPVYALGGLGDQDISNSIQRGGQGVAAISAWWPERE